MYKYIGEGLRWFSRMLRIQTQFILKKEEHVFFIRIEGGILSEGCSPIV